MNVLWASLSQHKKENKYIIESWLKVLHSAKKNQYSITLITYLNIANAACKLWLQYAFQNDTKMTTMAHKLLICDAIVIESK